MGMNVFIVICMFIFVTVRWDIYCWRYLWIFCLTLSQPQASILTNNAFSLATILIDLNMFPLDLWTFKMCILTLSLYKSITNKVIYCAVFSVVPLEKCLTLQLKADKI